MSAFTLGLIAGAWLGSGPLVAWLLARVDLSSADFDAWEREVSA